MRQPQRPLTTERKFSPASSFSSFNAVSGEAEAERVREALEKSFYLGAGRARAGFRLNATSRACLTILS